MPGGPVLSFASSVSADGRVIVGESRGGNGIEAFRYIDAGGMEGMGDFDNDGNSDVLWRNNSTGQIYLFLMDVIGIKSRGSLVTVGDLNWQHVHVADFNGDGYADIFWRNGISGQNWMTQLQGINLILSEPVSTVPDLNWEVAED